MIKRFVKYECNMDYVYNFGSPASSTTAVTPFTMAKKAILTKEKVEDLHRAVIN